MKLPSKKITISAVAALTVVVCGVSTFAIMAPKAPEDSKSYVQTQTELKQIDTKAEPAPTPVEDAPAPTTVSAPATVTQEPTPPPVVARSFDEIIMDYDVMSRTPQIADCSRAIAAKFPHRFQDHNREHNIKLLATSWSSMCYLIYDAPVGDPRLLTEDWFAKNGAL